MGTDLIFTTSCEVSKSPSPMYHHKMGKDNATSYNNILLDQTTPKLENLRIDFNQLFKSQSTPDPVKDSSQYRVPENNLSHQDCFPKLEVESHELMTKSRSNLTELLKLQLLSSDSISDDDNNSGTHKSSSFNETFDEFDDSFLQEESNQTEILNSEDFKDDASVIFDREKADLSVDHSVCSDSSASLEYLYEQLSTPLTFNDQILIKTVIKEMERLLKPRISHLQNIARKYELLKQIHRLPSVEDMQVGGGASNTAAWSVNYNDMVDLVTETKLTGGRHKREHFNSEESISSQSFTSSKKRKFSEMKESPGCEKLFSHTSSYSFHDVTPNTSSSISESDLQSFSINSIVHSISPKLETINEVSSDAVKSSLPQTPSKKPIQEIYRQPLVDSILELDGDIEASSVTNLLKGLGISASTPQKKDPVQSDGVSVPGSPPLSAKVVKKFVDKDGELLNSEINLSPVQKLRNEQVLRGSPQKVPTPVHHHTSEEKFMDSVDAVESEVDEEEEEDEVVDNSSSYYGDSQAFYERSNGSIELIREFFDDGATVSYQPLGINPPSSPIKENLLEQCLKSKNVKTELFFKVNPFLRIEGYISSLDQDKSYSTKNDHRYVEHLRTCELEFIMYQESGKKKTKINNKVHQLIAAFEGSNSSKSSSNKSSKITNKVVGAVVGDEDSFFLRSFSNRMPKSFYKRIKDIPTDELCDVIKFELSHRELSAVGSYDLSCEQFLRKYYYHDQIFKDRFIHRYHELVNQQIYPSDIGGSESGRSVANVERGGSLDLSVVEFKSSPRKEVDLKKKKRFSGLFKG